MNIDIKEADLCPRFISVIVEGVKVGESPKWLANRLIAIGEKSINNIVDITNYVQFAINKPIHAYNKDFIKDKIIIRLAEENEKLLTLDNRDLELNNKTLVVADSEKVLGLAGIKGGKYSGINNDTNTIVIESANFDPISIRKSSQRYNIRTDASKRFENGLSDNLAIEGVSMTISLLAKLAKEEGWDIKINSLNDNYPGEEKGEILYNRKIIFTINDIYNICNINIPTENIKNILKTIGCDMELENDNIVVTPPKNRLDLNIKEDIIEEIIRIYGFDNIIPSLPTINRIGKINKYLFLENIFRNILLELGYSEVYNYSFRDKGEVKILKPLAEDKKYLRDNLANGMMECLEKNKRNTPLMRMNNVKIFEVGNIWRDNKEERLLCIGLDGNIKSLELELNNDIEKIKEIIKSVLNIDLIIERINHKSIILEINLENMIKNIHNYENVFLNYTEIKNNKYTAYSQTPFIVRDISWWMTGDINIAELIQNIKDIGMEDVYDIYYVDTFQKGDMISHTIRIIYQNKIKTLTDEIVKIKVSPIYKMLQDRGYTIR